MSGARKPGATFFSCLDQPTSRTASCGPCMSPWRIIALPTFRKLTLPLFQDLKKVFKTTDGQVFIFPSTGTGAWEAALTNTLSPGDKVLVSRFGQFSHLWIDLAQRHGLDVIVQEEEWGTGVKPDQIEEALRADKATRSRACSSCRTRPRPA